MSLKQQKIPLEMLSAYLDNQLSEKDRSKVESVLQIDPALKHDLYMLDATRRLLRNAPKLKVPRNFTLSPSMIAKNKPFKFWMPAMSFSSAIAAILFALSFVFNIPAMGPSLTLQTRNLNQFTTSDSINVENIEMADESFKSTSEETPIIIQWFGEQASGLGGGGPAAAIAEGEIMAEEPAYDMEVEPETFTMDEAEDTPMDTATSELAAEEPAPVMEEETLPASIDTLETETDGTENTANEAASNLILGVSPEEERGQIIEEPQQIMPQMLSEEIQYSNQNKTLLAVLRGGLILLSITFAFMAYLMHRQRV